MREGPILFSGPMVRVILNDSKTKTRRPYKIRKHPDFGCEMAACELAREPQHVIDRTCPYGQPGDRLWVKETFYAFGRWETRFNAKKGRDEWHFVDLTLAMHMKYLYEEPAIDKKLRRRSGVIPTWWKRPAIFMPRVASRITLEIVSVRLERLQNITEADAKAEGADALVTDNCTDAERALLDLPLMENGNPYRNGFALLWESINGTGSWAENIWVWLVEFRRVA